MTTSSESSTPIPPQRALIPSAPRLPAFRRWSLLPAIARGRELPAVTKTAGAVAVGLVLEYALRGIANVALARIGTPARLPAARATAPSIRRTIVTEVVVIERYRRRG